MANTVAELQAELASVKACWAEALENVATRNRELEQLRAERHQLRNELTAAGLENERLRAAMRKALNVWDNYRITDTETEQAIKAECEALVGATVEPNAAPPHCPTCLCGIGHCPKHPAAIFHPPAACPECASGNAAYSIEGMMAAEKSSAPLSHIADCQCKNPWTDTFYEVGKCPLHGSRTGGSL